MKSRNELMTVKQLHEILTKCIENGHSEKYIQVNEYFVGYDIDDEYQYSVWKDQISLPAMHVQDVIEYGEVTGDEIEC
jgi:hypothetical protein